MSWFSRCSWCGGAGNEFVHDPNPFPYDNTPEFYDQPPQPQYESYSCELCGNDAHYGYDCPPQLPLIKDYRNERINIHYRRECEIKIDELKAKFNKMSIEINKINKEKEFRQREHVANLSTLTPEPSRRFNFTFYDDDDDDDDEERTMPLSEIISQLPPPIVITTSHPVLPIEDPEDSLIMGNEELSIIPEKESDEFINSSVEDLVSIPSEFEDTSGSDKNIESKDSYVSNLDEPTLLVTPLSDANEDECFDPGGEIDEIDAFLDMDISTDIENGYHDSKGDIMLASFEFAYK
ncbi:hypothetical protein Tco_0080326 [Tanacetum coccineum]